MPFQFRNHELSRTGRQPLKCREAVNRALIAALTFAWGLKLLMPFPADAQSLQEALTQAYRTNPQLDAARATLRATDEDVAKAHSGYRPVLSGNGSAGWTRTDTRPESLSEGQTRPGTLGVTLAQPIFRGFRTLTQIRVAEANVRAARENLRNTEHTILLQTATAYLDAVRDQAVVRFNEGNVQVLTQQLAANLGQFRVNDNTRTDVAQTESRLAGARASLELAKGNLAASKSAFERMVGQRPGVLNEVREPIALMPKSLGDAVQIAMRENAIVANALYQEQAARFTVDQIRGELLPTITLNSSFTRNFDPSRPLDLSDERSVKANMTLPLYSGGEIEARVRQAKHTHVARIQQISQARTEQQQLVAAAWARYSAAKEQGRWAGKQIEAAKVGLAGVREEYRVGQRTLIDVLNAEQEFFSSQINQVTARREAMVQAYTILQLIGRLDAVELGLGGAIYDAEIHLLEVRRRWFGLSITHADGRREGVDASEGQPIAFSAQ